MSISRLDMKALDACRKYYREAKTIKDLTRYIGDELSQCPLIAVPGAVWLEGEAIDKQTHLSAVFQGRDLAILQECEHCRVAYDLVQRRKAARQRLGAAKRYINRIGKQADV